MVNALRRRGICGCLAWTFVLALCPIRVHALPRYGPLEVAGSVSAQNLFRMSDVDQWGFVQQRNTFKLRVEYNMFDKGKLIGLYDLPYFEQLRLFMLYRGVYDSVYDALPRLHQKDIYGLPIRVGHPSGCRPGSCDSYSSLEIEDLDHRDEIKFENDLREAYIDVRLKYLPLSFRLGKQMIVWGETDNFRLLDRVNALDLSWHLQQEVEIKSSWDELRIPYWMVKGLYDIGQLGPLSETFIEAYWNPGDWYTAKKKFLPRPWSLPLTNPIEALSVNYQAAFPGLPLANNTKLFGQADYKRNPMENSQVGIRFNAVTPQRVQFTLNYFYQRWSNDDGTDSAAVRAITDPDKAYNLVSNHILPIEAIAPYVHTFGLSANYSDEDYTGAVFRTEMIYEMGVPFSDASKQIPDSSGATFLSHDVFGVTKRDMWDGSVAFDRPTWIRWLNRKTTVLVLGQFFWHYLLNNEAPGCIDPNEGLPCNQSGLGKGFVGALSSSQNAQTNLYSIRNLAGTPHAFFDRVRSWETLATLAAVTFYRGGTVMPLLGYAIDPTNRYNMEVFWTCDYFLTNNFIINVGQKYFVNTTSRPVFETWGLGGVNRGRSETQLRLTYQF